MIFCLYTPLVGVSKVNKDFPLGLSHDAHLITLTHTWVLGMHVLSLSVQKCVPVSPTIQAAVCLFRTVRVLMVRPQLRGVSPSLNPTMHHIGDVYSL